MSNNNELRLLDAVSKASDRWKNAFNDGDASLCSEQYEVDATMEAMPFGTYKGRESIKNFWENLIKDGFTNVEYIEPKVEIIDKESALLTSGWKMNKAAGVIHKEIWVLQQDGTAKLREDKFEAK